MIRMRKLSHYVMMVAMLMTILCQIVHSVVCACQSNFMQGTVQVTCSSSKCDHSCDNKQSVTLSEKIAVEADMMYHEHEHHGDDKPNHDFSLYVTTSMPSLDDVADSPSLWQTLIYFDVLASVIRLQDVEGQIAEKMLIPPPESDSRLASLGYLRPHLN